MGRLELFRQQVSNQSIDSKKLVRKEIIFGHCEMIDDETHLRIREEAANFFEVHPNNAIVVGSAKLGFSIKPKAKSKKFHDESDIDLALVDSTKFDYLWERALNISRTNKEWSSQKKSCSRKDNMTSFFEYVSKGWIRPDLLPYDDEMRRDWFHYMNKIPCESQIGVQHHIKVGLYKSHGFLEHYQRNSLEKWIAEESRNED